MIEKKIQNKVENANFCATNPALELYFSLNFHRFLCKCMFRGVFFCIPGVSYSEDSPDDFLFSNFLMLLWGY